mmetsp:Transcript_6122/g.11095  ORF Transcript_6122/g.11095 Transcript_6122/m.11095 type:complete len:862 (+) Transcript_6122:40-2625(+)
MKQRMSKSRHTEESALSSPHDIEAPCASSESAKPTASEDEDEDENDCSASSTKSRQSLSHHVFTIVILMLGAAASAAFMSVGIVSSNQEDKEQFHHEAEELCHSVESAIAEYEVMGLWAHQACFRSAKRGPLDLMQTDIAAYLGMCSREEWHNLYVHLASRSEFKFQAVQFLPKIYHFERAELERQSRDYFVNEIQHELNYTGITHPIRGPDGLTIKPRENSSFYWPVHYVEPLVSNEVAVELDGYADAERATRIDRITSTFQPSLSKGIRLVQETDPHAKGLILRHPGVAESILKPVEATFISQIVLRVPDLLNRATDGIVVDKSVYLYDSTESDADPDPLGAVRVQVIDNDTIRDNLPPVAFSEIPRPRSSKMVVEDIEVADRHWICAIVSPPKQDSGTILFIALGGAIIMLATILLAVWFQTHMTRVAKISELRSQAEEEKAASAQRQVIKEREMNEFLSHEVRNPLASSISALSFVTATVNDSSECHIPNNETRSTVQEDLRVMSASLQFINELLRNMLDIHRSASHMQIVLSPTDILHDILEPVASILFMRGASSAVQVQVECPKDLVCEADRMRLKQIVLNLSSNAAKFVQKGYIRLVARTVNGSVEISVEDSGPGIPESKRHQLFQKFQQSLDELNQGTGIGLAVCKNLSDLMGAEICLDDAFDSGVEGCLGTRFVIRLNQPAISVEGTLRTNQATQESQERSPLVESSVVFSSSPEPASMSLPVSLSVLFVDDDTVLRRMFTRALKRVCPGWDVSDASNGETALRLTETRDYDVIFMDQYMASIEKQLLGTETVRALRSRGVKSVICGLSANDMEQQFKEAGADAFLFKPFPCEKEALSVELTRVLKTRGMLC